jgi:hypothetical protein
MSQKLAAFNADYLLVAFYDDIDSPPPDGVATIPITDQQWSDFGASLSAGMLIKKNSDGTLIAINHPAVTVVPSSVSPAQARLALHAAGLLDRVETIVASADITTKIAWNNATVIDRNSPTVTGLAAALNLTSTQLDQLFTAAAAITV